MREVGRERLCNVESERGREGRENSEGQGERGLQREKERARQREHEGPDNKKRERFVRARHREVVRQRGERPDNTYQSSVTAVLHCTERDSARYKQVEKSGNRATQSHTERKRGSQRDREVERDHHCVDFHICWHLFAIIAVVNTSDKKRAKQGNTPLRSQQIYCLISHNTQFNVPRVISISLTVSQMSSYRHRCCI